MKHLLIVIALTSALVLTGCVMALPTPADICALSAATQAAIAAQAQTTVENLTAACEIIVK